ncbi:stage VI sporulation protein D [Aquibacillus halophilus]|uniref:stage VI sporulation protein D n=1 Tax=Aquibacillus halophilus TaxID=930132 RepID=UPI00129AAF79|nr:stage VI sporulation protein D [Aquibacillus halophilus]
MANGDQSVFTFDLSESLWFEKGQEVDEIMGISLEPEISIQEFDDFISIRGVIELKGEYFQVRESAEEEVLSLRDHPSQRFVDRVESYEDGVNEFFHNFPVEVSIPKYRIDSLDDVMVGIESFDYELPENSQLKLNAVIAIHGVVEDRTEPTEEYQEPGKSYDDVDDIDESEREEEEEIIYEEPLVEEPEPEVEIDETFEFDLKEKEEENKVEVKRDEHEEVKSGKKDSKNTEKERWKNKKSQSLSEFFGSMDKPKKAEKVEDVAESMESSSIVSFSSYSKEESEDDYESSREERVQQDTTYLMNIFEDDDEDRFSSMKMCIVQESDTLSSLAEKYNISALNISKTNRLEDDQLSEGQILYIPNKNAKVK